MEEPSKELVLFHCGNILIDHPASGGDAKRNEQRRKDLKKAFMALMQRVDEEHADLVLFSGNLVDTAYATNETLEMLVSAFRERPYCSFVIAPGPQDPYRLYHDADAKADTGFYLTARFPENVYIFREEPLKAFEILRLGVVVYGWAFRSEEMYLSPLSTYTERKTGALTLLCGYTSLEEGDHGCCPMTEEEIADFGAAYAALTGKPHGGFPIVGNSMVSFSGDFECQEAADAIGGFSIIRARREEQGWALEAERASVSSYRRVKVDLDVSHVKELREAAERLKELIDLGGYDRYVILDVTLCGAVSPRTTFYGLEDAMAYGVHDIKISDCTLPIDGAEMWFKEMSALGELFRHFYPAMMGEDEAERQRAARAFRIGCAALQGGDVTRY